MRFDPWGHFLYTGIANAAPAPADEEEQASYVVGDQATESPPRSGPDNHHLQDRYRHLVDQITSFQRGRMQSNADSRSQDAGGLGM